MLILLVIKTIGWQNLFFYPVILNNIYSCHSYGNLDLNDSLIEFGVFHYLVCLPLVFYYFMSSYNALKLSLIVYLLSLVFVIIILKRTNYNDKENIGWSISLSMLLYMLVSPHLFVPDLTMLVIPAALTMKTVINIIDNSLIFFL